MKKTYDSMRNSIAVITFFSIALFSCQKNQDAPGITYNLKSINKISSISGGSNSSINWTNAFANVTEIHFQIEKDGAQIKHKSDAHKKIDLFSTQSFLGNVVVPPGTYTKVEFEIELVSTSNEAAFELKGTYNTIPVIFKVNGSYEIETERDNVTIADGKNYTAITALDLSLLTKGVTETMLNDAVRTNGEIVISSSSNVSIFEIMRINLHTIDGVELQ